MGKINFILGNYSESVKNYGMSVLDLISDMELYEIDLQSIMSIVMHCGSSMLANYIYNDKIQEYYNLVESYRATIDPYYAFYSKISIVSNDDYNSYQK